VAVALIIPDSAAEFADIKVDAISSKKIIIPVRLIITVSDVKNAVHQKDTVNSKIVKRFWGSYRMPLFI
jgi:hypothetical protein